MRSTTFTVRVDSAAKKRLEKLMMHSARGERLPELQRKPAR